MEPFPGKQQQDTHLQMNTCTSLTTVSLQMLPGAQIHRKTRSLKIQLNFNFSDLLLQGLGSWTHRISTLKRNCHKGNFLKKENFLVQNEKLGLTRTGDPEVNSPADSSELGLVWKICSSRKGACPQLLLLEQLEAPNPWRRVSGLPKKEV